MTNAEAWFNNSLRPRKPEGSLGRPAQDGRLDYEQFLNYEKQKNQHVQVRSGTDDKIFWCPPHGTAMLNECYRQRCSGSRLVEGRLRVSPSQTTRFLSALAFSQAGPTCPLPLCQPCWRRPPASPRAGYAEEEIDARWCLCNMNSDGTDCLCVVVCNSDGTDCLCAVVCNMNSDGTDCLFVVVCNMNSDGTDCLCVVVCNMNSDSTDCLCVVVCNMNSDSAVSVS